MNFEEKQYVEQTLLEEQEWACGMVLERVEGVPSSNKQLANLVVIGQEYGIPLTAKTLDRDEACKLMQVLETLRERMIRKHSSMSPYPRDSTHTT